MDSNKKNVVVLTPEILCRQTCTECHKYLSVGPVVMTRRGQIICGRCKVDSLYNQFAEGCLFPCVNYNAGCLKVLSFNEAKDHEANCSKKDIISCPFCKYEGDEVQLVQHFKEEHSECVVDNIFELIPEDGYSRNLIFLKDEHILCITIKTRGKFFHIYNSLLTPLSPKFTHFVLSFSKPNDNNHAITFRIRIAHESKDFPVDTDTTYEEVGDEDYVQLENCFLVARDYLINCLRADSYYCRINYVDDNKDQGLQLAKQKLKCIKKDEKPLVSKPSLKICAEENPFEHVDYVLKMDPAILKELVRKGLVEEQKCSRCMTYMTNKDMFYICPKRHCVCKSCSSRKCPECKSFVQWNTQVGADHSISLKCQWNCNKGMIDIVEYGDHVQSCKTRLYKCPDKNCHYKGFLDDFKKHWHLNKLRDTLTLQLDWKEQAFYWLLRIVDELVYVTFDIISNDQGLVTINEEYAVSPQFYEFVISGCPIKSDWISLKDGIGRCQSVGAATNKSFELKML